jgi:aminoglycoside phosphotransferase (APT) family kinase protein
MAAPNRRNTEQTRQILTRWIGDRILGASIHITDLVVPAAGTSSDTLFVDAEVNQHGRQTTARWVFRIQATSIQIYQDPAVERQFLIQQILGQSTKVPVPHVRWLELDPSVLGAPFYVMDRIEGRVAANYNAPGWLANLAPKQREKLWLDAIEKLARVHLTDPAQFSFLNRPTLGPTGLDQEIAAWNGYLDWSGAPKYPMLLRGQRWLADHAPKQRPSALSWGDAQFTNLIFSDHACLAVIDWETVSLGGAEEDLAWWLLFDEFYSTTMGMKRLHGLGDRQATLEVWSQHVGRKPQNLEWHDVFACWKLAVIAERTMALYAANGNPLPGISSGEGNPYIASLGKLLAAGS